ncbi:hypothetical protein RHGRI_036921 [Rhododendron griersonianum]|uniref:Uncharacterized protein n=1 Tax=Rhododendron griersonianum TaxID=479676 RepID=A0AAV6HPR9_9ERIC|nr:hypothetical protein RHGRI_036921 [Rhododendron griersonianum]
MVVCKRARTKLCKREISFLHLDHQNRYFPDHQNYYYPSKRESTKQPQLQNQVPLGVWSVQLRSDVSDTLGFFFFILLVIKLRVDDDDDVWLMPLL